ncbi:hypothetical protein UlMin_017773 [Ulmus minor]
MLSIKLQLLLISSFFFSFSLSQESPQNYEQWVVRRHVLEASADLVENSSLILAAERTHRKDPLRGFNYYTGGWNISEKHYFSSVGFTGAPLFILSGIWFVGFVLCLLIIALCHCCCQYQHYAYSPTALAISFTFLVLFSAAAIIGCVVLYIGQGKFHSATTNTLDDVVKQAEKTVDRLNNVSDSLSAAKNVGVAQIVLPSNIKQKIDGVEQKINASSKILEQGTEKNSDGIRQVLDSIRLTLIIIAAVMMLLALLGFFFSVRGMERLLYVMAATGWILVTITFILAGIFLLLHNAVADTCVAMEEWVENPTARSALDDILPCVDNQTAQETLYETKDVTFQMVDVVNQFITNIANLNIPPQAGPPLYYAQSGPLLPILCNPFHPNITSRQCARGEVDLNNAGQEWRKFVCQVSTNGTCTTVGRLTPSYYDQLMAIVNLGRVLNNYGPFLAELADCTFVRRTFSDVIRVHCPGLRRDSQWIVIGLSIVSAAIMFSLIFWILYAREKRHRSYTKLMAACTSF